MPRAVKAWIILIAITLVLTAFLALGGDVVPPKVWLAIAAVASLIKARMILLEYLGLRDCAGWRGGFMAGLTALVVVVYGLLAVG